MLVAGCNYFPALLNAFSSHEQWNGRVYGFKRWQPACSMPPCLRLSSFPPFLCHYFHEVKRQATWRRLPGLFTFGKKKTATCAQPPLFSPGGLWTFSPKIMAFEFALLSGWKPKQTIPIYTLSDTAFRRFVSPSPDVAWLYRSFRLYISPFSFSLPFIFTYPSSSLSLYPPSSLLLCTPLSLSPSQLKSFTFYFIGRTTTVKFPKQSNITQHTKIT